MIHGARAALGKAGGKQDPPSRWLGNLRERRHPNVAAVALANKNARIVWAMLASDKFYEPKLSVQARTKPVNEPINKGPHMALSGRACLAHEGLLSGGGHGDCTAECPPKRTSTATRNDVTKLPQCGDFRCIVEQPLMMFRYLMRYCTENVGLLMRLISAGLIS